MSRSPIAAAVFVAGLASAGAAAASIWIANSAGSPGLRVDARGNAEASWTAQGKRRTQLVPPRGQVLPGGRLPGRNVAVPASGVKIPLAVVVKRTPGGWLWALQSWSPRPSGPVELHLARWQGEPTKLELAVRADLMHLDGRATFHGRPVTGFSPTPAGKRVRIFAYVDCFGCPASPTGWIRLIGVAPRADGSFSVFLRPEWIGRKYRATIAGPNLGLTRAPDTRAEALLKKPPPPRPKGGFE